MTSFIGIYDNVINRSDCGFIINEFEASPDKIEGTVLTEKELKVIPEWKKTLELREPKFSDSAPYSHYIKRAVFECMERYVKKFMPHIDTMFYFSVDDIFTFQKHETGDSGYKAWHCEHGPSLVAAVRLLAWQVFLNDSAGIDFLHYRNVKGKMGRVLIWPAGFTHMHRSSPNRKGNKYIVNGWASLR